MMSQLRREVLSIFKKLHRTKQVVFRDDIDMLIMSRGKINEEFKLNKNIAEEEKIKELIETAKTCEHELRTAIIQVAEKSPNQYVLRLREDNLVDNVMFNPDAVIKPPRSGSRKCKK